MKNRICSILGIEKPIIQGPMVWLTDAKLAAAVSEAGGLGSLRVGMLEGDMDNGYVSLGNRISFIHSIKSVKEIIDGLIEDFK
ncbi:MAG: nitronate monooxygenase [Synergistaceae bacterium]|nr:nitronate monooxygenase [Synergistaceae bacterium]MBR0233051.1 nitronate monooxygenase [Synergistaceae bacterium]